MQIELLGGPGDGIILAVPADTRAYRLPVPHMTPAQFIALESGAPASQGVAEEHLYVYTPRISRRTKATFFAYTGKAPKR